MQLVSEYDGITLDTIGDIRLFYASFFGYTVHAPRGTNSPVKQGVRYFPRLEAQLDVGTRGGLPAAQQSRGGDFFFNMVNNRAVI